ncbi:hypothetical protein F2P79_004832 [Pimephales promelas]|nr:hypothetical protein F2P79_004832 [Pimephales promelas]
MRKDLHLRASTTKGTRAHCNLSIEHQVAALYQQCLSEHWSPSSSSRSPYKQPGIDPEDRVYETRVPTVALCV